jgi:hypothetical protein
MITERYLVSWPGKHKVHWSHMSQTPNGTYVYNLTNMPRLICMLNESSTSSEALTTLNRINNMLSPNQGIECVPSITFRDN